MTRVAVRHDGGRPLCEREIALMRRLDCGGAIAFVNAASTFCPRLATQVEL